MKMATMIKVRLLSGNADRPPAGARYKRAAIFVVRLGQDRYKITKECQLFDLILFRQLSCVKFRQ